MIAFLEVTSDTGRSLINIDEITWVEEWEDLTKIYTKGDDFWHANEKYEVIKEKLNIACLIKNGVLDYDRARGEGSCIDDNKRTKEERNVKD